MSAVSTDIHASLIEFQVPQKGSVRFYLRSRKDQDTSLRKVVEQMVHTAFKEGCKCGKGGFTPSY